MNNIEKAIHILKEELADGTDLYLTFATAISSLEKQIPKKPINDRSENESTTRCGCCNAQLVAKFKHCPRCGQTIDWSVEE